MESFNWLIHDIFPNFIQNLSILATLGGTILTVLIWIKTKTLYEIYNKKASSFYIVDKIALAYQKYTKEIKDIKDKNFYNSSNKNHIFWEIIKETNGNVIAYEIYTGSSIGQHIQKFKSDTSQIVNISRDSLTYDNIWNYYDRLTELHQILKSIQDIDVRKMSK